MYPHDRMGRDDTLSSISIACVGHMKLQKARPSHEIESIKNSSFFASNLHTSIHFPQLLHQDSSTSGTGI